MNDTILATPPMASPAFSPLYSQAGYDSDKATNANQFLSTLHSRLMGILAQRVREALKTCNMCTCSGNGTQERAVQDLLCLVDLYLVYLI